MLEHIRKEISYIAHDYYRFDLTLMIDGKEYTETESCTNGEVSRLAPLEGQLHKLVPDVDINLIIEFLSYVENTNTSEGFGNVQRMWDDLVNTQKAIRANTDKFNELHRVITETRDTIFRKGWDICKGYTTKDNCEKCPFNNDRECRLSSTLAALKSLQDACAAKGMKR